MHWKRTLRHWKRTLRLTKSWNTDLGMLCRQGPFPHVGVSWQLFGINVYCRLAGGVTKLLSPTHTRYNPRRCMSNHMHNAVSVLELPIRSGSDPSRQCHPELGPDHQMPQMHVQYVIWAPKNVHSKANKMSSNKQLPCFLMNVMCSKLDRERLVVPLLLKLLCSRPLAPASWAAQSNVASVPLEICLLHIFCSEVSSWACLGAFLWHVSSFSLTRPPQRPKPTAFTTHPMSTPLGEPGKLHADHPVPSWHEPSRSKPGQGQIELNDESCSVWLWSLWCGGCWH